MTRTERVFIGWDPTEMPAYVVAEATMRARATVRLDVTRLALGNLRTRGIYTRPTEERNGRLWDVISEAPMSTEHAIARFFVPRLCRFDGWALFTDADVLALDDVSRIFDARDDSKAVMVVEHPAYGIEATKKAGATQTAYPRKWWSSVMLWNCAHPANVALDDLLNAVPGRDLHGFCWLTDGQIGDLDPAWNYLVGVTAPRPETIGLAHFTLGTPDLADHEHDEFSDEWHAAARVAGYRFSRPIAPLRQEAV